MANSDIGGHIVGLQWIFFYFIIITDVFTLLSDIWYYDILDVSLCILKYIIYAYIIIYVYICVPYLF